MVNGIFHTVFFWLLVMVVVQGWWLLLQLWRLLVVPLRGPGASFRGILGASPLNGVKWSTFIFRKHRLPGHQPGQHSFFFCYGRKCVRTKESSIKFAAFLRWLLTSRLHTHQPLEPPRLFFVPLSRTLGRTCERVITPSDAEATTFSTLLSVGRQNLHRSSKNSRSSNSG